MVTPKTLLVAFARSLGNAMKQRSTAYAQLAAIAFDAVKTLRACVSLSTLLSSLLSSLGVCVLGSVTCGL